MSSEQWIALFAVVVAALALVATTVLAVALRRVRADVRVLVDAPRSDDAARTANTAHTEPTEHTEHPEPTVEANRSATGRPVRPDAMQVVATTPLPETSTTADAGEIVTRDGRVVVVPSTQQVVDATLGKPMIRGAVLGHGIRYALRPESRDRLRGMVRREYRRRRRIRLRAGRRAARAADIPPRDGQSWLSTGATRRLNVEDDGGS